MAFDLFEFLKSGALISTEKKSLVLGWGPTKKHKSINHLSGPVFYFPDFYLTEEAPYLTYKHSCEVSYPEFIEWIKTSQAHGAPLTWKPINRALFLDLFQNLQTQFINTDIKKGVPFTFCTSLEKISPSFLLSRLVYLFENLPPSLHPYGFWNENEGIFGATPELLFSVGETASILNTAAIAGTCSKKESKERLLSDPKQLVEHHLVVKGIVDSLSSLASVNTGNLAVLELPTLYHLMTPIYACLHNQYHFEELIYALHPTPALGAFPKNSGSIWLASLKNKINRRRFGAPIGVIIPETMQSVCWVAIRSMQWNNTEASIFAGCGVVPESTFENEWSEIQLKIQSIKGTLGL